VPSGVNQNLKYKAVMFQSAVEMIMQSRIDDLVVEEDADAEASSRPTVVMVGGSGSGFSVAPPPLAAADQPKKQHVVSTKSQDMSAFLSFFDSLGCFGER